jgi:hypothetical protein
MSWFGTVTEMWQIQQLVNILNRAKDKEVMVFNATFNNISVISRQSVLFVGET